MRSRKPVGKMVRYSRKGEIERKGQGQVRDKPKLKPGRIHRKVQQGKKERKWCKD